MWPIYTHRRKEMRTNVVIDDDLMASALKASGLKTKKDAIEEGLKLLVQLRSQKKIKRFRGKLKWSGNLDEMRSDK
jgi:Arc/MetJ family transcription regulator